MIETTVISVAGLSGRQCAEKIDNILTNSKGVDFATTNLEARAVTVVFNVAEISREAIVRAITDLGFEAH